MMCRIQYSTILHVLYPFTGLYVDMAKQEKIFAMLEPHVQDSKPTFTVDSMTNGILWITEEDNKK